MKRRPKRLTLAGRFTLGLFLVILFVVALLAVLAESHMRNVLVDQAELRASSLALSLAAVARPYLLTYNYPMLQQLADATLGEPDLVYVIILDKEGTVAGYSGDRLRQGARLTGLADLRAANMQDTSVQRADHDTGGGRFIEVIEAVVPVRLGTDSPQRWGTMRVGISLDPVRGEMLVARAVLALAAVCGLIGAAYVSRVLARGVMRPLARLADAATRLERGELDPGFSLSTGDEIELLASRFASAAHSLGRQKIELEKAKEELTALNGMLEQKVEQRTSELATSREKYRLLVEGSPDAFVLLEQDRLAFVNKAFLRIFGYSRDAGVLEEMRWTQIIHPDFHDVARRKIRAAEESHGDFYVELIGQTRSGRPVELEVHGRGVHFRGGTAVELVLSDVGRKRRLVRQVVQSERLRAMGEMTAMVAHNFNNLLAVILGRTQLLLHRSDTGPYQRSLESIQTSAQRAGEMVRQLQEYFGDQVDLRFTDVDLNTVLRDTAVYLETLWQNTRPLDSPPLRIKLHLSPLAPVLGAEPMLEDVFRRLLANAAEAMPEGGEIHVYTESGDRTVRVRVVDNGVGMTPGVLRHAFDPFFTTSGSRMRGLGLPASFGIVQRHNGRIELHSSPGEGTTVEVILPTKRPQILALQVPRDDRSVEVAENGGTDHTGCGSS